MPWLGLPVLSVGVHEGVALRVGVQRGVREAVPLHENVALPDSVQDVDTDGVGEADAEGRVREALADAVPRPELLGDGEKERERVPLRDSEREREAL